MNDEHPSELQNIVTAILAAIPVGALVWGAIGGGTNAIVIKTTAREAIRHIVLGALVAAGMGGLGAPILNHWLSLPPESLKVVDGAAGGSIAYLTGSVGAAILEVVIQRIRAGRLPNDKVS